MPLARQFHPAPVVAALALTLGCRELGAGPCVHTYRDPMLALTAATDANSGARVTPLLITAVSVDGQAQRVDYLLAMAFGAGVRGDTLICHVPCGFGTSEGRYAFIASAVGYTPRPVAVDARFARFEGGCPSFNEGSTRTSVALPPSP